MKTALYCRVSSEEQREKQSIETQIDFAIRYADLHEIEITETYKDDGVSGGIPCADRPEGARMLEDAEAHKFDLLLIYKVSRLGRDQLDLLHTAQWLEDCAISLRSMTEPFDTSTPTGKFILQMLGSMAELDKANIKDNSVRGSMRVAREGKWVGGTPPLGYKVVKENKQSSGRLVVDPAEAEVVHRIFTLYTLEGYSTAQVAALLNAEGIPACYELRDTERATMGWHNTTIHKVLTNRTYIGKHHYNKRRAVRRNGRIVREENTRPEEQIVRDAPTIIEPELFEATARRLAGNNSRPGNARRQYLLRGLIKCSICGASYVGTSPPPPRHGFYYKCANYQNSRRGVRCQAALVRGDLLEEDVWADIVNFAYNPGKVIEQLQAQVEAQTKQLVPVQVEQDVIRGNIAQLHAERANVIRFVRKGTITDVEADSELTEIAGQIKVLEDRAEALSHRQERAQVLKDKLSDTGTLLRRLAEAVEGATWQTKRALIKLLVDGIMVETVHHEGNGKSGLGARGAKVPSIHATYVFEAGADALECINTIPGGTGPETDTRSRPTSCSEIPFGVRWRTPTRAPRATWPRG